MRRIGIAASKMSKGSLVSYNLYVVLIACLLSVLFFAVCGFSILLVLFFVYLIMHAVKPSDFHPTGLMHILKVCLAILAVFIGVFNIIAIAKNLQLTKNKT